MKKYIVTFLTTFIISCAACENSTREEVTKRYSGGEKKEVVKYQGTGSEEKILERLTFSINGELVQYENLVTDSVQNYLDLNSELNTPTGFKKYIHGSWKKNNTDADIKTLTFFGDTLMIENISINPMLGEDTKKDTSVIITEWLVEYRSNQKIQLKERISESYKNFTSFPDTIIIYNENSPEKKLDKNEDWTFIFFPKDSTSFEGRIFDNSQFIYSKNSQN